MGCPRFTVLALSMDDTSCANKTHDPDQQHFFYLTEEIWICVNMIRIDIISYLTVEIWIFVNMMIWIGNIFSDLTVEIWICVNVIRIDIISYLTVEIWISST